MGRLKWRKRSEVGAFLSRQIIAEGGEAEVPQGFLTRLGRNALRGIGHSLADEFMADTESGASALGERAAGG